MRATSLTEQEDDMDSISTTPQPHPSPRPLDLPFSFKLKVLDWTPNDVDPSIFEKDTVISFSSDAIEFCIYTATWFDDQNVCQSVTMLPTPDGKGLESSPVHIDQFVGTLTLVQSQITCQWNGTLTPQDPALKGLKGLKGNAGTFVAQAEPDPQPPVLE